MSGTEALMWSLSRDPLLRPEFVYVALLDQAPDEHRLHQTVERAVRAIPRMTQKVEAPIVPVAAPDWVESPDFDSADHVRILACPQPADQRALLDHVVEMTAEPLDPNRPLWSFTIIEGLADGRAAFVQQMHHSVIDGVGGLRLSLSFVDLERDPDDAADSTTRQSADPGAPRQSGRLETLARALGDTLEDVGEAVRTGIDSAAHLATHPQELPATIGRGARMADSLRRQLAPGSSGGSPLLAPRSAERYFEVRRWPLEELQNKAHSFDATVNDVYVAGLVGALGLYHDRHGEAIDSLPMAIPVSLRQRGEEGGNRFAPVRLTVPVGPAGSDTLLRAVHELLAAARTEPALEASDSFAGFAVLLPSPLITQLSAAQGRSLDLAASNLRGSPIPLFMAGTKVEATFGFGPRTATAVNATTISYCGEMCTALNIDPASITDLETFVGCIDESFSTLLGA